MTDQSSVHETGPLAELPWIEYGSKQFSGSAGLVIGWSLDATSTPPALVCAFSALTPHSEYTSGKATYILRLSLEARSQPFQVERRASHDEADTDSSDVNPRQASGVIYLGKKNDQPGMPHPDGKIDPNTPLYLHVHCRLGASSAFVGKIARGTYKQLLARHEQASAAKEEIAPAATPDEPAATAVTRKKPAAPKAKARSHGKPSR